MLKDLWLNSQLTILNSQFSIHIVAPLGVEPRRTEPESAVLPLHNRAEKVAPADEATFYIIN